MSLRLRPPDSPRHKDRPYTDEVVTPVSEWTILIAQPTRLRLLDHLE